METVNPSLVGVSASKATASSPQAAFAGVRTDVGARSEKITARISVVTKCLPTC